MVSLQQKMFSLNLIYILEELFKICHILCAIRNPWTFCLFFISCNFEFHQMSTYRAWIPDVILFESKTISLTFELRGSLGIPRPVPSAKFFSVLGAGLGIPSEPRNSKVRLIVLLSNRMTSGIHAL